MIDHPFGNPVPARGRRAQAAFEFLATYGWAFLVILVVIGALAYFGVLNPSRGLPDKCVFGNTFGCPDYQITASGSKVNFVLTENMGASIFIQGVNATTDRIGSANGCLVQDTAVPPEIKMDSESKYNVSCTLSGGSDPITDYSGDKVAVRLTIRYRVLRSDYVKEEKGDMYATVT